MMTPVRRILVIGLSNVGDAVLMSPVIERLSARYPQAHLTLFVGERAHALFMNDPRIHRLVLLEEFAGRLGRLRLARFAFKAHPDLLIDLRQTVLPFILRPWRTLRYFWPIPRAVRHMRDRHLWRLKTQDPNSSAQERDGSSIWLGPEDRGAAERLLARWHVDAKRRLVLICPGARSHIKRWSAEGFARLADRLIDEAQVEVVFTGEPDEASLVREILDTMHHQAHNAVGTTTIRQLAALITHCHLVITNDSASLHLACAVNVPVLALFGPTDPRKYGPTGVCDRVIQRRLFCVPCEQALCRFHHECMRFITADEVYRAAKEMLASR